MRLLDRMLSRFVRTGSLTVIDPDGVAVVHKGAPGPECTIRLTELKALPQLAPQTRLAAAGHWLWLGRMAMYLAEVADVEVLGVTLSTQQQALATPAPRHVACETRCVSSCMTRCPSPAIT